jgi:hypothetical protein
MEGSKTLAIIFKVLLGLCAIFGEIPEFLNLPGN